MTMLSEPRPLLRVVDLEVRYGDTVAVDHVNLEVPSLSLIALLGPSGCGKTSLLRAIAGFEQPTAGCVEIAGKVVASDDVCLPAERRQVGMVFQQGALFPHLTVGQNVLYGVKDRTSGPERAHQALELVGLAHLANRFPDELSGGEQQRVALARALAPSPQIVLLDEPFANLDASLRTRLRVQMREILSAAGTTAVLVTHDQEEALSVADRVAVMHGGRVLQYGTPEEVYHHPSCLDVARFVGEGQLVPCRVQAGKVRCAYGTAVADAADGEGNLFVRPEDLQVLPEGHCDGQRGEVVSRRFFGHDLLSEVRIETGETLQIRELSSDCAAPGTPVRVCLRSKAFPVFSD